MNTNKMLRIPDVVQKTGLSRHVVDYLVASGQLPMIQIRNRKYISEETLTKWCNQELTKETYNA